VDVGRSVGADTLFNVPAWRVSGSADHPWLLRLSDDANWSATVTADRLEVVGNGTLVFFESDLVALVIQPRHYSYVRQLHWTGLTGDE
jgi:hypothetical protein